MSKKFYFALIVLLLSATLFSSCAAEQNSALSLLTERLSNARDLPAGRIYARDVSQGEGFPVPTEPLCGELALSLYGDGELVSDLSRDSLFPEEFLLLDDYCVWLCSTEEPFEVTVLRARGGADTTDAAKMLLRRLRALQKHYRESPYAEMLDGAEVSVVGRYVILELLP